MYFFFVAGLHQDTNEQMVHIDTFSAMNGISRFCERDFPWRYILLISFVHAYNLGCNLTLPRILTMFDYNKHSCRPVKTFLFKPFALVTNQC